MCPHNFLLIRVNTKEFALMRLLITYQLKILLKSITFLGIIFNNTLIQVNELFNLFFILSCHTYAKILSLNNKKRLPNYFIIRVF